MSKEMHKSVRSVGTRPGTKYRIFKLHKQQIESNPQFPSIWLAFQIPAYKLLKFLVPILNHLTKGEYTHKVSFQFAEETCDQDLTMGDLDKDSLFHNIPLGETVDICVNQLFKNTKWRHYKVKT